MNNILNDKKKAGKNEKEERKELLNITRDQIESIKGGIDLLAQYNNSVFEILK